MLAAGVLLGAGLLGCDGSEEDAPAPPAAQPGRFEAEVRGALQAALSGTATARVDTAGRLAGLELNVPADTSQAGLSFELTPASEARLRTYTAGRRRSAGAASEALRVNAYLRVRGYAFQARAGSLRVRADTAGLTGTFGLMLRGLVDASSDDSSTVAVRGSFRGLRPAGASSE